MKDSVKLTLLILGAVLWVYCMFLVCFEAKAEEILRPKLRIVEVLTSHEDARDVYQRAKYYFRKVGVRPRVTFIKEYPSLCVILSQLENISEMANCFKNDAYFTPGFWKEGEVTFYYLPRISQHDKLWTFGAAYRRVAIGGGVEEKGAVVLFHEAIGHALGGAPHIDTSCNVMNSAALHCIREGSRLEVLPATKRMIRRNIRRKI